MPAPTFVAVGTVVASGTSLAIPYYAGLAADDIAIAICVAGSTPTFGTITGFTLMSGLVVGAGELQAWWRRLTGAESGTVTQTITGGANGQGAMFGVRGAITTGDPFEGLLTQNGSVVSQTSDPITTTVANTLGVRLAATGNVAIAASSPPAGWDERLDSVGANNNLIVDTKEIPSAGTEPASTRTQSTGTQWGTITFAMLPEPSGSLIFKKPYLNPALLVR